MFYPEPEQDEFSFSSQLMKIKTWTTWILLLLLPGSAGWLTVFLQRSAHQQRVNASQQLYKEQAEEYLAMYDRWNGLSTEDKLENPWGQDPYGGPEIMKKLREHQDERLLSSLPDLLGGADIPPEMADILFGADWQQTVDAHRQRLETQEIILIMSSVLLGTGGLLTAVFLGRAAFLLVRRPSRQPKQPAAEADDAAPEIPPQPADDAEPETEETETPEPGEPRGPSIAETLGYFETVRQKNRKPANDQANAGSVDQQLSDISRASLALLEETRAAADPALENLMTPEPVAKELNELTEQMSAIRQFAAEQQTHIRKLQDGYDWLIIKRFCLRIIRCIDNLEDRLVLFESKNKDTSVLQDIHDELIFALESSGVEAFEPDLGREYRGFEKYAEAVKERTDNEDPARSGTIAEIVRPGYQYLISDEDVKIVRCAQVKLYA